MFYGTLALLVLAGTFSFLVARVTTLKAQLVISSSGPVRARAGGIMVLLNAAVVISAAGSFLYLFLGVWRRSRGEKVLLENQARLAGVLNGFPAGLLVLDSERKCSHLNSRLAELSGRSIDEHLGKKPAEVLGPLGCALEEVAARVQTPAAAPAERQVSFEIPPGTRKHLRLTAFSIAGCEGTLGGVGCVVTDESERVSVESALRERESSTRRRLEELLHHYDTAPIPLSLLDTDLRFVHVNQQMAALNGVPVAEHVGRTLGEVIPEIAKHIEQVYHQVIETGEPVLGLEVHGPDPKRDGESGDWVAYYHPLQSHDGRVTGVSGVVIDVTERKRAEEALRRSERFSRLINDNIPALLARVDRDQCYTYVNRRYEDWLGVERQQILGRHLREVLGEDFYQTAVKPHLDKVMDGQETRFEDSIPGPNGNRYGEVTFVPDLDENGEVLGFYGFIVDITDLKKAEEQQRLMMHELDHRVKNNLQAVLSLAEQTMATCESLPHFRQSFISRLMAMARSHEALARRHWTGIDIAEAVELMLAPFVEQDAKRLVTEGSAAVLPSSIALPVSLSLNELATNATKYGALSSVKGWIELCWRSRDGDGLVIEWTEHGGPRVSEPAPQSEGFGLRFIRGLLERQVGGQVEISFKPEGLVCVMKLPLSS